VADGDLAAVEIQRGAITIVVALAGGACPVDAGHIAQRIAHIALPDARLRTIVTATQTQPGDH